MDDWLFCKEINRVRCLHKSVCSCEKVVPVSVYRLCELGSVINIFISALFRIIWTLKGQIKALRSETASLLISTTGKDSSMARFICLFHSKMQFNGLFKLLDDIVIKCADIFFQSYLIDRPHLSYL